MTVGNSLTPEPRAQLNRLGDRELISRGFHLDLDILNVELGLGSASQRRFKIREPLLMVCKLRGNGFDVGGLQHGKGF
jgi:hypothetical protein